MAEQRNREGQRFGNYRLECLLGRGGFAEVYLGHHLRLQRQAAIKILHAYLSEQEIDAFQREAQIIAALDHPHIVRILDFDVQNGVPFLVMDYLPNGTLRQRHNRGERVPLPTVISYVKQVADALHYAHEQRLIHRDVKPENMLVGRRNEVVLSDFGIAAIAHSTSSMTAQASIGTIPYMAPEQIQEHPRPASDQYALGIVVYEWLSGELPFVGSFTEIFAKHLMTPPPPLRQKVPTVSGEVEQVVLTALAKEPRQRFGSIQAFATALEEASRAMQKSTGAAVEETVLPQPSSPLPPTVFAPPVIHTPTDLNTPAAQTLRPTVAVPPPAQTPPSIIVTPPTVQAVPPKRVSWPRLSRRTVIIGLAAVGVAAAGGGTTWWVLSPHPLYTYRGHSDGVNSIAWSPDGKRIASGGRDTTVQVWNAADGGNVFTYRGHSNRVWTLAWSPDGTRIASGSDDNTVQVWNAADGGNVFTYRGHSNTPISVAWSPDGKRIASASWDQTVQVWDAVDGGNVFTYRGHSNTLVSVAWSPDGKRIASGSSDTTVQVWDAVDGGNVFTYHGHSDVVNTVAWSPDGKRIASGSWDHTVQVWDAVDGGNVFTYRGHSAYVNAVVWSPDGMRIASGGDDKTVQVWEAK